MARRVLLRNRIGRAAALDRRIACDHRRIVHLILDHAARVFLDSGFHFTHGFLLAHQLFVNALREPRKISTDVAVFERIEAMQDLFVHAAQILELSRQMIQRLIARISVRKDA